MNVLSAVNYANTKKDYTLGYLDNTFINRKEIQQSVQFHISDNEEIDFYGFTRRKARSISLMKLLFMVGTTRQQEWTLEILRKRKERSN